MHKVRCGAVWRIGHIWPSSQTTLPVMLFGDSMALDESECLFRIRYVQKWRDDVFYPVVGQLRGGTENGAWRVMSVKVTSFYWDCAPHLDGNDKMLLLALADWCNDDGFCYYGMEKICKRLGREPRTVQTIIKSLEDRNELLVCPGEGKKTLTGVTNRYYLLGYCRVNNIVIPNAEVQKAKQARQKQREFGVAGWRARKQGVQEPAPQGVQEPAPQGVQKPAPQGVQKPAPNTSVDPSVDPSGGENARVDHSLATTNAAPTAALVSLPPLPTSDCLLYTSPSPRDA